VILSARNVASLFVAACALSACRDERAQAPSKEDGPGERVFETPARVVRAVPPHRIQPAAIGPYQLGDELKTVLNTLPHGPRIELLQIEHLASYRLVRVAQDTMLVGIGQAGRVSFIAVLDPEIAKTESGLGVGSEIDKLQAALGPERPPAGARDPRLVELERLPGGRVLVQKEKVAAIVIGPDAPGSADLAPADALSGGGPPGALPSPDREPAAPAGNEVCSPARAREVLAGESITDVARVGGNDAVILYGCFTGGAPEAVVVGDDQLVLVAGEPGRLRRVGAHPVPGLVFASAVDAEKDGRAEIVAVSEKRSDDALAIEVQALRGDGARLVQAGSDDVYRVTAGAASSVGAKLKNVSVLIEATAGPEALEVTGFYVHENGGHVRTIAPLVPKTVVLRPRRRGEGGSSSAVGAGGRGVRPPAAERSPGAERGADD
jgi:hypothetical protein